MEKKFINWIRTRIKKARHPEILKGIGDDAAVCNFGDPWVVTSDTVAEGTHFDLSQCTLTQVGNKAVRVSLSDLAAMAARPIAAMLNLQLPKSYSEEMIKELFNSVHQTCDDYSVDLIGGDTNSWNGPLVVTTTLFGSVTNGPDGKPNPWLIDTAQQDDVILVSGFGLGGSLLGYHLNPEPRCKLAEYLNSNYEVTAATDLSDSLAIDLAEIARQSGLGFQIASDSIPIRSVLAEKDFPTSLDHALYDGEDFEILLTCEPTVARELVDDSNLPVPVTVIGKMTADQKFRIRYGDRVEPLVIRGYEH